MVKDFTTPIKRSSLAAGDITGDFTPINIERLPQGTYSLRIKNDTSQPIIISYDGTYGHEYVLKNSTISIDSQTNNILENKKSFIQAGYASLIYIRWAKLPALAGNVYLMGYQLNY